MVKRPKTETIFEGELEIESPAGTFHVVTHRGSPAVYFYSLLSAIKLARDPAVRHFLSSAKMQFELPLNFSVLLTLRGRIFGKMLFTGENPARLRFTPGQFFQGDRVLGPKALTKNP